MNRRITPPSSHLRPMDVHFLFDDTPTYMLVLAKSHRHAVQVMFRFFELSNELDRVKYNSNNDKCFVSDIPYFSDQLYKHLKKSNYGNN